MKTIIARVKYNRGTLDESKPIVFGIGEPIYLTDIKRCCVGDGQTAAANPIGHNLHNIADDFDVSYLKQNVLEGDLIFYKNQLFQATEAPYITGDDFMLSSLSPVYSDVDYKSLFFDTSNGNILAVQPLGLSSQHINDSVIGNGLTRDGQTQNDPIYINKDPNEFKFDCEYDWRLTLYVVPGEKLQDESVAEIKLADQAVSERVLATNSVSTVKIIDKNVTQQKIGDSQVVTRTIQNTAVTEEKLADISVSTRTIQPAQVDSELHIGDLTQRLCIDRLSKMGGVHFDGNQYIHASKIDQTYGHGYNTGYWKQQMPKYYGHSYLLSSLSMQFQASGVNQSGYVGIKGDWGVNTARIWAEYSVTKSAGVYTLSVVITEQEYTGGTYQQYLGTVTLDYGPRFDCVVVRDADLSSYQIYVNGISIGTPTKIGGTLAFLDQIDVTDAYSPNLYQTNAGNPIEPFDAYYYQIAPRKFTSQEVIEHARYGYQNNKNAWDFFWEFDSGFGNHCVNNVSTYRKGYDMILGVSTITSAFLNPVTPEVLSQAQLSSHPRGWSWNKIQPTYSITGRAVFLSSESASVKKNLFQLKAMDDGYMPYINGSFGVVTDLSTTPEYISEYSSINDDRIVQNVYTNAETTNSFQISNHTIGHQRAIVDLNQAGQYFAFGQGSKSYQFIQPFGLSSGMGQIVYIKNPLNETQYPHLSKMTYVEYTQEATIAKV